MVGSSPWLFAATHVLHRHQAPRHPPLALCSLENKDARARYGVLKGHWRGERPPVRHKDVAGAEARCSRMRGRYSLKTEQRIARSTVAAAAREDLVRAPGCQRHLRPRDTVLGRPKPVINWESLFQEWKRSELLRKEVIQPHLPVRLPCYDFTPITDPTFDSSLLAVGPLASGVTDFRGVTGGVYKARERIHPGDADPGLLATPASRSRVADSDPN